MTTQRIRVVDIVRTTNHFPSQWEGTTDDGLDVYVRYRNNYGEVTVSASPGGDACDDDAVTVAEWKCDHGKNAYESGCITYEEIVSRCPGIDWPTTTTTR